MSDAVIQVKDLTKDYGHGRGIYHIDLEIPRGQVFGYVGTNGSGKTTTIRHLMGFVHAGSGSASVCGMDSWKNSTDIMNYVSYVPGEIAFPALATGTDFLKLQAEYLGIHDFTYMNHVISLLQLDPTANLKRMSKGMKQKTAIVAALMGDKEILILDEPTTGLDPLMRDAFLELIREEKAKGRTIFMSSHIFEEIEDVCDKVAMIKDGKLISTIDLWNLRHWETKTFNITFSTNADYTGFLRCWNQIKAKDESKLFCQVEMPVSDIQELLCTLREFQVASLKEEHITLNQYFTQIYMKGDSKK